MQKRLDERQLGTLTISIFHFLVHEAHLPLGKFGLEGIKGVLNMNTSLVDPSKIADDIVYVFQSVQGIRSKSVYLGIVRKIELFKERW